jgi:hypothetical protein
MSPAPAIPRIFLEDAPPLADASELAPKQSWYKRRSAKGWLAVALVVAVLIGLQTVGRDEPRVPFDPDSPMPNGTKGFVELMQRSGARVDRNNYPTGRTAVLNYDTLNQAETDRVEDWIEAGGTLVISDPYSSFQLGSFVDDIFAVPSKLEPKCDATYVRGVEDISPARKGGTLFYKQDLNADSQCFRAGKNAFFLEERVVGRGRVVALGGSEIFTNDRLGKADNAVLLMNIVQPGSSNPVTLLETRDESSDVSPTEGGVTLSSLYSDRFRDGMWMLFTAVILFMLFKARRLGRPVEEEPLVRIPASQLVVATGDLLELAQQPRAAAAMLRDDLRRSLAERFGLRADTETGVLVELISQRTGIDPQRVRVALNDDAVNSPESLVAYAQHVERLQMEVKHVR